MLYQSTRSKELTANSAEAVLNGLAPDGGLYVFSDFRAVSLDTKAVLEQEPLAMAAEILTALLPDFSREEMQTLVRDAYRDKFSAPELTPTIPVGEDTVLELFHGPTSAFKDVALSVLPHLMTASQKKCGVADDVLILTATSGDTGKAAMEGFRDVPGTKIIVFYPHGGVSEVQRMQMATQEGGNVKVCAIRGNFDDAQTAVKQFFADARSLNLMEGTGARPSSANSINIGRLAPQVVYYYRAYADLMRRGTVSFGDPVDFVVPTGNFGDILAGYFAKQMGLPVGRLVCASNANDVLTEFLQTGRYDRRRPFYRTVSPSMDILVSSNLERMLFLSCGEESAVADWMRQLREEGFYQIPQELLAKLHGIFWAGSCDDAETKRTIGEVWTKYRYLCDPHTAVAWRVAQQYKAENPQHAPLVILSTASPYKFPAAVLEGIGSPDTGNDAFAAIDRLHELTGTPVPANLSGLRTRPERHKDVIDIAELRDYVLQFAKE